MTTTQWANIGEDAGALHALLARIPEHAPISAIDYLWIFPARKIAVGESVVIVIAAFDEDPDRRRVSTAHFTISRNRKGAATVNLLYSEHASAPDSAVSRIVEGVLRRLGEDTDAAPREERIEGDVERWATLIVDLGGRLPEAHEPGTEPATVSAAHEPPDGGAVHTTPAPSSSDTPAVSAQEPETVRSE
jgi:hypothetical protein